MKIHIHPAYEHCRSFAQRLPETFAGPGKTLHRGRNTVRAFDVHGERLVVKRFKRPGLVQGIVYGLLRKSKARRAYEHAVRLHTLGFDSPRPVAWIEYRRRGRLADSYFISLRSDFAPLSDVTGCFPSPETLPVLDAFAQFAARLHEAGVVHEDFNHGNILYRGDPASKCYRFQLIDINRMRFRGCGLSSRECMINLRRLSCPAGAFLYILDRYAENLGWNVDDTLLQGTFFRLAFGRRREIKKRFRQRRQAALAKRALRNRK